MRLETHMTSMAYCVPHQSPSSSDASSSSFDEYNNMVVENVYQLNDSPNSMYQELFVGSHFENLLPLAEYDANCFSASDSSDNNDGGSYQVKHFGSSGINSCPVLFSKKPFRTSRTMRNVAEKQRRDKLNNCISKLANIVPLVSLSNKRVNKSGILRLAASYLRLHNGVINGLMKKQVLSGCLPYLDRELSQLLLKMTEGFAVITNESLKIIFASDLIEELLGHSVVDVLGQSFYSLIHSDDHSLLEEKILSAEIDREKGDFSLFCSMVEGNHDGKNKSTCKLMRIIGHRKTFTVNGNDNQELSGKMYIFIVKLCLVQPRSTIAWTTNPNEITFRSAFTGRCVFVDHKLSILLGIMPSEIEGSSGYDWIYKEDHPIAAIAHTQMLQNGFYRGYPIRLLTRNKQAIFFMTAGKLVSSVENGQIDLMYMHCTMISTDEGERVQALLRHRLANQMGSCAPCDFDVTLANEEANQNKTQQQESSAVLAQPVKRPRGRPRKYVTTPNYVLKSRRTKNSSAITPTV